MKVYQYETYFVTTEDENEQKDYLAVFDVTKEEADLIEKGVDIRVQEKKLIVTDELTGEKVPLSLHTAEIVSREKAFVEELMK